MPEYGREKKTPDGTEAVSQVRADVFHAGIVRGNRVAVNINIQTGMVDEFTLISHYRYKIK
jgi:hypothetical protein